MTATSLSFTDVVPHTRYQFRIRGYLGGGRYGHYSSVVRANYVDLVLPVVRIDTVGGAEILDRENYVPGTIEIDPNGHDFKPYSGTMGIRGRGNSTWAYPKKPYRFKLDTKSEIMGIAAERDWVLLANFIDRSQLRTYAAMKASEATSMIYTPTLRPVEVVLNGRYAGVYVLTQHNEIGPDRVDITEMSETDNDGVELTGGYRLEIDARLEQNNEPGWRTPRNVPVVIKDPDPATPEQFAYIRNLVNSMESAMYQSNFAHPQDGWRRYVDMQTFIDQYLIQELTYNQDAFFSSTYMTKERGEDWIKFGPVWDFDNSQGSVKGVIPMPPEGWWARTRGPWMTRVFQDPTLEAEIAQRWQELRPAFQAVADSLEAEGATLTDAILNDASRWQYELDETDTPEFLTNWWNTRIAWISAQLAE